MGNIYFTDQTAQKVEFPIISVTTHYNNHVDIFFFKFSNIRFINLEARVETKLMTNSWTRR